MPLSCGSQIHGCRAAEKPHLLFSLNPVQTYSSQGIPVTPKLGDQLPHNVSKPIPHTSLTTHLINHMWIHAMPVDQLLDNNQLTIAAGQKEAVQVILHMEIGGTADCASVQI